MSKCVMSKNEAGGEIKVKSASGIMRLTVVSLSLCMAFMQTVSAAENTASPIAKVFVVNTDSVHIVYENGRDITVTKNKKFADPKVAEDKLTVGWLNYDEVAIPESNFYGHVSRMLTLYRNGKIIRTITSNEACIKGWKFVKNGEHVAVVDGGLRSGYVYKLYAVSSGKILQTIADPAPDQIPAWGKDLAVRAE